MNKKIIIAVIAIIAVVAIGISILSLNQTPTENMSNSNVDEFPDSSEFIGKEKAIEIFNNRDQSTVITITVPAGSPIPGASGSVRMIVTEETDMGLSDSGLTNATDAQLIKKEGVDVYKLTLKSGYDTYYAYVNAKTGEIL
ncbi:MAG: PepSY domain-containing protein [Methanobrevibacter sp.]|nr:PepSY domain-containing protein [Methanobrevibacter sp.]